LIRYINGYLLFPLLEKISKRNISSKRNVIREFDSKPKEEQSKIQRTNMFKILEYCNENIPYYRDLFKEISFNPKEVLTDITSIKRIPVLTKEIVKANTSELKSPQAWHGRKTGGSTGQSVHFFYDDEGLDWTSAINLHAYDMAGNFVHKKDCHISSELGIEPTNIKGKFLDWLKLFSQNRTRLMISSFSDKDLENSFKQLKRVKPYLLQGHPSTAYALAQYIKKKSYKPGYCKVFEPSGEMLTDKMVQTIEKYLGCKVVNRYGNAEFGVMAHSLLKDNYNKLKVFNNAFYIEECQNSDLIVTGFTNTGMPLIRYNTGDIASVCNEKDGTFIYDIQGRIHDSVYIEDEPFATHFIMDYLDHVIKGVREFQIILEDSSIPSLKIIPEEKDDFERIKREILLRWPKGINVELISYKDIEKVGWRQKFRHLIDKRDKNV